MAEVVAKEDLFVNGVKAHNAGDAVPAENVEPNGWEEQVTGYTASVKAKLEKA